MIRRVLGVLAIACAAACSKQDPVASAVQGTIAGQPFVPVESTGFVMGPVACANPELAGWTIETVEVQFWSYAGACELATSTAFCGAKASARVADVAVARVNVNGGAIPPILPGTYTFEGTHVADPNGVVNFLWTSVGALDGSCAPLDAGMPKEATSASITLEEVGPSRLRGHVEVAFDNGDVLSGAFDAPVCPSSDEAQCLSMKGGCAPSAVSCAP